MFSLFNSHFIIIISLCSLGHLPTNVTTTDCSMWTFWYPLTIVIHPFPTIQLKKKHKLHQSNVYDPNYSFAHLGDFCNFCLPLLCLRAYYSWIFNNPNVMTSSYVACLIIAHMSCFITTHTTCMLFHIIIWSPRVPLQMTGPSVSNLRLCIGFPTSGVFMMNYCNTSMHHSVTSSFSSYFDMDLPSSDKW